MAMTVLKKASTTQVGEMRRIYTESQVLCITDECFIIGVSDRVQCAFCAGVIRNWEKGDIPKQSHKNFFNYCKMVQSKFSIAVA